VRARTPFSRSVLQFAKILLQSRATLRNATRIRFAETSSASNAPQGGEKQTQKASLE